MVKGTFPQYKPPETHSMINNKLEPELLGKMRSLSQKNFLLENIKKSKQSPERKKNEEGKSMVDKTFMKMLGKNELSKTSINVFTNKDLSTLKGNGKKNEKLDPMILNSYKLKTTEGFKNL